MPQTSGRRRRSCQTERLAMVLVVMVVDDSLTVRQDHRPFAGSGRGIR